MRRAVRVRRALARALVLAAVCVLAVGLIVSMHGSAAAEVADGVDAGGESSIERSDLRRGEREARSDADPRPAAADDADRDDARADPAQSGQTEQTRVDMSVAQHPARATGAGQSERADQSDESADRSPDAQPGGESVSEIASGIMATSDGGDVRWRIDDAGVLTISGHGRMTQAGYETPWAYYREQRLTRVRIQGDPGTEGIVPESTRQWFAGTDYNKSKLVAFEATGLDMSACADASSMFYDCKSLTALDVSGWDTSSMKDMSYMFCRCSSLPSLDVSGFDTSKVTDISYMFSGCSSLSSLDVTGFDTSQVTSMSYMFEDCSSLPSLDVTGFDTSKVTTMDNMFYGCSKVPSLDVTGFDTSKVTDMTRMFQSCSSLPSLDVTGFDTSQVTDMSFMFYGCSSLPSLDVTGFDTSKVTVMSNMFTDCSSLPSLDVTGFDTSQVTRMSTMFTGCTSLTSLDLSGFDTSKVTSMESMFNRCSSLTSLDLSDFDTSKVKDMTWMFVYCSKLSSLDLSGFDTSQVTRMFEMFCGCSLLTSLDLTDFDTSKVTDMSRMFRDCRSLSRIDLGARWAFKSGGSCELREARSDEGHTGMWQAIGEGTEAVPLGRVLSAKELMETYDGKTMADAYVWQPAFHLVYEANADDAAGSTAPTRGGSGATVSVSACGFRRPYDRFTRWSTEPDGSGASYVPGDPFVLAARSQVLYAQWETTVSKSLIVRSLTEGDAPVAGAAYVLGSRDGDAASGVEAYTDEARTERASWPQRSGADGELRLYGLVPGTYHLFGTEVPAGYQRAERSHEIVIDERDHAFVDGQPVEGDPVRLTMVYERAPELPGTGATAPVPTQGLCALAAAGTAVAAAALARRAMR
ncbi:lipoprotein [Coriobacterium glomerans PW2]|uniref:Lipoprotein n=2 Tax=Coriobacterium TaxID=33870 RepID=F2NBJ4_CORGP|nr:lipoprotein [Coriobacterium glomerans PW2]